MEKIDTANSGIEAARRRENEYHPLTATPNAWDKRSKTLQSLVFNCNELIDGHVAQGASLKSLADRVAQLEVRPAAPFPARSPGGAGG